MKYIKIAKLTNRRIKILLRTGGVGGINAINTDDVNILYSSQIWQSTMKYYLARFRWKIRYYLESKKTIAYPSYLLTNINLRLN